MTSPGQQRVGAWVGRAQRDSSARENQSGRQMKRVRVVTLQMVIGDNRTVIPSFRQFNWGRFYWVTSGDSVINKSAKTGEAALLEEELAGKEVVRGTVDRDVYAWCT